VACGAAHVGLGVVLSFHVAITIAPRLLLGVRLPSSHLNRMTDSNRAALRRVGPDISARGRTAMAASAKVVGLLFIQVGADLITEMHKFTDCDP